MVVTNDALVIRLDFIDTSSFDILHERREAPFHRIGYTNKTKNKTKRYLAKANNDRSDNIEKGKTSNPLTSQIKITMLALPQLHCPHNPHRLLLTRAEPLQERFGRDEKITSTVVEGERREGFKRGCGEPLREGSIHCAFALGKAAFAAPPGREK